MKDKVAKAILRIWPGSMSETWEVPGPDGIWVRARPPVAKGVTGPFLHSAGARLFKTQPDGLWVYLRSPEFADVICIEVCQSDSNLNDKRSRYMPTAHSLILKCPKTWLLSRVTIKGGRKAVWDAARCFDSPPKCAVSLPVRSLRVLYALRSDHYDLWIPNHTPAGHEFFCVDTSLKSHRSPTMRAFFGRMSIAAQFYTQPYK